ncbi:MAG: integrase arm-type DNA-binding domain-containing protein [Paracoccus sp. (in: a-proteobacteria)]|nr:site-specific integrase [Paracoccus sp. (in: a-proteobacteria)]MDO5632203.1 integrase arm-type DNA-binding domain-containing protein [Paracoccus sp. (in: a-proteobacteria)]
MHLTARACAALPAGRHADGGGLYLNVSEAGGRSWVYRYPLGARRREMGLGAFPDVSLAEARRQRDEWARVLREGGDPLAARAAQRSRAAAPGRTLVEMTQAAFEAIKPGLRDDGDAGRWLSPLRVHILPLLGRRDVESLNQNDIADALRPIWRDTPDAAMKALQRIGIVLRHAAARSFEVNLNAPALAREILGDQGHQVTHIAALPYSEVPGFYATLTAGTPTQLALRLLILTANHSRPIRFAHADQFDLDAAIWTIPAEGEGGRMKGRKGKAVPFRVPLSYPAVSIAREAIAQSRAGYLFPGKTKGVISDMAMTTLMSRAGMDARPHGFRSSFRDWAAETGVPEHLAEMCLAHKVGTSTSRAYRRTDELEARRSIMDTWAGHVTGQQVDTENVTLMKKRAGK